MPRVNPELVKEWNNSKIKLICGSIKNFKGAFAKYAYDKKTKIYSTTTDFQGKKYIITTRIGPDIIEMMLTDKDGKLVEHAGFVKSELFFKKGK